MTRLKSLAAEKALLTFHTVRTDAAARREDARRAATPLEDIVTRAREKALGRVAEGRPAGVPLAFKTALGAERPPSPALPPDNRGKGEPQPPERVRRTGRRRGATPLGVMVRGMVRPGSAPKEDSRFAYASGSNYMDRQLPPGDRE